MPRRTRPSTQARERVEHMQDFLAAAILKLGGITLTQEDFDALDALYAADRYALCIHREEKTLVAHLVPPENIPPERAPYDSARAAHPDTRGQPTRARRQSPSGE